MSMNGQMTAVVFRFTRDDRNDIELGNLLDKLCHLFSTRLDSWVACKALGDITCEFLNVHR